ncbi:MAG: DUF3108 domain-containing protein [Devosiaceae bacterium]|nr:DUF3108 domain-containing protein [Devosiaceae bacterium]
MTKSNKIFSQIAFFGVIFVAPVAQAATPLVVNAKYVLSVAGTIVADMNIQLNDSGSAYTLNLDANVAGLGNLVAQGSATIEVSGTSAGGEYAGESFQLITRSSQSTVDVKVQYANANVTAFVVTPPLQPRVDQVPVQRSQLRNVADMLSAFVLQANTLDRSLCDRKLRIFTGVERFDLDMRFVASEVATSQRTGYQGPVVACQLAYNPISGHYTSSEITSYLEASERMLIWYAPIENSNTFIPYRVLIGTSLGDLSMVLTRLN